MRISNAALEEAILTLLCHSPEAAPIIVDSLKKYNALKLFTLRVNSIIASTGIEFLEKHGGPVSDLLETILEHETYRGEEGKLLLQTIKELKKKASQFCEPEKRGFILDNLHRFIATSLATKATQDLLEALDEGEDPVQSYEKFLAPTLAETFQTTGRRPAFNFADASWSAAGLATRAKAEELFTCGFEALDAKGVHLRAGKVLLFIAGTGNGKSWYLSHIAKNCILMRQPFLLVSFELSEDEVRDRLLQACFPSIDQRWAGEDADQTTEFHVFEEGSDKTRTVTQKFDFLHSKATEEKVRRYFDGYELKDFQKQIKYRRGPYMIRQLPPNSSIEDVFRLYDRLTHEDPDPDHKPRVVLIDHIDDLRASPEHFRFEQGDILRKLRAFAQQRNIALYTATQANRASAGADRVTANMVAESYQKNQVSDLVLVFSQSQADKERNEATIEVAKSRTSRDKLSCKILQIMEAGQFCIDTRLIKASENKTKSDWKSEVNRLVNEGRSIGHAAKAVGKAHDTVRKHFQNKMKNTPDEYQKLLKRKDLTDVDSPIPEAGNDGLTSPQLGG